MKHIQMITMMCVICLTASCTTQKVAYRERFEEAKGYALYACIAHMNKFVDSTSVINKDYSGEYFVQLSSLSLEEIIGIKEYVDKECMNYWSISHNPEGNMIAYSSWKFYNSKDLDNFIRKTLRKNIGNNERQHLTMLLSNHYDYEQEMDDLNFIFDEANEAQKDLVIIVY